MKKFLLTLAVMAMAVPAMAADIDFSATDNGDGSFTISYVATTAPRGVALTIDTDGATIGDAVGGENGDVKSLDAAFNCYMDYANFMELDTPGSYTVGAGHPLASQTQAGLPTFPASSFSVCMGVLDELGNQDPGPLSSTDLITLQLSGAANVTIDADTYRSETGAVGSSLTTNLPIQIAVTVGGPEECIKADSPMYADWESFGKPDCWCYQKQCQGDADGIVSGPFRVANPDLQILLGAFNKLATLIPPGGICADFDHLISGPFRVANPDLQIFLPNFNQLDALVPACSLDWDGDLDDDYNFWITP